MTALALVVALCGAADPVDDSLRAAELEAAKLRALVDVRRCRDLCPKVKPCAPCPGAATCPEAAPCEPCLESPALRPADPPRWMRVVTVAGFVVSSLVVGFVAGQAL